MHVKLGGYHICDIEFVAAFDVDKDKVGKDLSEAIFSGQNNTFKFMDVPHMGVKVERGMTHDGLGKYLSQVIEKAPGPTADVVGILKDRKVDVMVSYLPVGSEEATKWYVEQALQAGVGFINAIPVFIGREPYWQRRFAEEGLPVIGDDIKSQVGATITHRVLTRLFMDRGVRIDRTYQLNFGGNTDFLNMLERERLESKKISKTNAVTSMLDYELADGRHPRRPVGLRAVAQGPQVVPHPDRGHDVRRCAAQRRAQARGLGQPQQRGRHHRRHPLPEDRARPRALGHARRAVRVLHEEPAAPAPRRRGARAGRGFHPGRGQRDARRPRGVRRTPSALRPPQGAGTRHAVTQRCKGLEAPHRRLEATPPRIVEQAAVIGYRSMSAVLASVPPGAFAGGHRHGDAGALPAWPAKRRFSNANFSHVLGLPPATRASRAWRCAPTASTRATWSSSCACRPARRRAARPSRATATTASAAWRDPAGR